jgi:hypothetical protein
VHVLFWMLYLDFTTLSVGQSTLSLSHLLETDLLILHVVFWVLYIDFTTFQ